MFFLWFLIWGTNPQIGGGGYGTGTRKTVDSNHNEGSFVELDQFLEDATQITE